MEAIRVAELVSASIDAGGTVIEQREGFRYACQRCECVYSFSKTGVFIHNKRSQPLTPEVPRSYVERDEDAPDPNGIIPPMAQRPIPKPRPVS